MIKMNGTWQYDEDQAQKPVDIISLTYDWWYQLAESNDLLAPNEQPDPLNDDGVLFYVRFSDAGNEDETVWVESQAFRTLDEAIKHAEAKAKSAIDWQTSATAAA